MPKPEIPPTPAPPAPPPAREVVVPANVKFTRGPSHPIDARYQIDPNTKVSGGFLDEWNQKRGNPQ